MIAKVPTGSEILCVSAESQCSLYHYHHCHVLGTVLNLYSHDPILSSLQAYQVYISAITSQMRILSPRKVT